jgi:carboxymethylenebutenolidase
MVEINCEIRTPDGMIDCFAARPDGDGPFPPVIVYMDAPGIREELRDFTRRIAGQGYFCLLPDLYYRVQGSRFDLSKGEAEVQKMFAVASTLTIPMVMSDTGAMLDYLADNPRVAGHVGVIGYCMSGRYVVAAAASYPQDIAAVASLYGVGIVTDQADSPHLSADRISAELYLGFAEKDEYVGSNVVSELACALEKSGVKYIMETHPGTEHGFCFPGRGSAYKREAAERVWAAVFDLFERKLKAWQSVMEPRPGGNCGRLRKGDGSAVQGEGSG